MEFGSVLSFLENKTILVTGATGFLAKIFVEKVLRIQPNVKKLYLLLRAEDDNNANKRFHNEVIGKDLFRVLREKWGADFNSFISEKVVLVAGDITHCEELGIKDSELIEEMHRGLDVVLNLAATTNFDERYDVALAINTIGAKNVLVFAKKCAKLKVFVQVSTAYVSGEKAGLVMESPYVLGESLNGASGLDIDEEKRLIDEKLNELQSQGATHDVIKLAMKDMAIQRANVYGWPNSYVFTKAMGEMVIGHLKGNLPVAIVRPTIVTSTYKEPFPGWVEGVRTIDSLAVGYGKGKLTCFLGDINGVVDVIPADMVVNAILVGMVANASCRYDDAIYHVGSSVRNPVTYSDLQDYGLAYFTKNPWIGKDGKPVKVGRVKMLHSMDSFHRYMTIRYSLFLKGLEVVNIACCRYFDGIYNDLDRKIKFVMRLVELYRPYLFFRGVFDDMNTERLRVAARENIGADENMFLYFDPKSIDWEDYFVHTHVPGIVKYVFR